jgi:putative membrane protein
MTTKWMMAGCVALLAACGGGGGETASTNTSGLPETQTTGSAQSVQQTGTQAATTTAITGGTVSSASPEEKEFVSDAGMVGLAELQMANVALQKSENPDVQAYARRMVTDHTASNQQLAQLATMKGLVLPAELAGEHQSGLQHLQGLSAAEFDRAYMQHMVSDHQKALQLFQKASSQAQDAEIKAFATKTLPILQQHLQLAQQLAGKV